MKQNKNILPENLPEEKNKPKLSSGFFSLKPVLLSAALVITIMLILQIPGYSYFYMEKIIYGYKENAKFKAQDNYEDIELRKNLRWGNEYKVLKQIVSKFQDDTSVILMIPPTEYMRKFNAKITIPEPAVAYYYCGVKTARANSDYAYKCTHALVVNKDGILFYELKSRAQIDSFINVYKAYKY